jgi:hypothetical protein
MRPRLAALFDLVGDLTGAVRSGAERVLGQRREPAGEERSADEVKRRLDATRERLKRETPPSEDPPGETPPT